MAKHVQAWRLSPVLIVISDQAWAQFNAGAFEQGAGFSGENLTTLISITVFVLATIGLASVAIASFQNWADGRASIGGFSTQVFRGMALLILISVLLN